MRSITIHTQGSTSCGIYEQSDGDWLAMSYSWSRHYKTEKGARRALAARLSNTRDSELSHEALTAAYDKE